MASRLVCEGCGAELGLAEPYPFRCPHDGEGDVDHVLRRWLDVGSASFPRDASEPNPFLRYRRLLRSHHVALRHGLSDLDYQTIVRRLDREIAAVDGHGFGVTPFARCAELSDALGFSAVEALVLYSVALSCAYALNFWLNSRTVIEYAS